MTQWEINPPVNTGDARDVGLIPGLGRSPGVGNGNPLQYSCLEKPMDGGAWWATGFVTHGVTKSQTWLSDEHAHVLINALGKSHMKQRLPACSSAQWHQIEMHVLCIILMIENFFLFLSSTPSSWSLWLLSASLNSFYLTFIFQPV